MRHLTTTLTTILVIHVLHLATLRARLLGRLVGLVLNRDLETHVYVPAFIAKAFLRASALLLAPQTCKDFRRRVGLPFSSYSGPGMLPMRARKEDRRGLLPDRTGGLRSDPGFAFS